MRCIYPLDVAHDRFRVGYAGFVFVGEDPSTWL